jgi:hypothetical protein
LLNKETAKTHDLENKLKIEAEGLSGKEVKIKETVTKIELLEKELEQLRKDPGVSEKVAPGAPVANPDEIEEEKALMADLQDKWDEEKAKNEKAIMRLKNERENKKEILADLQKVVFICMCNLRFIEEQN